MRRTKILERRYLVGIPIPALDQGGRRLRAAEIERWKTRVLQELTACFGGATPIPAPGVNIVEGPEGKSLTLYEEGQVLVLSGCGSREEFLAMRPRIERLAGKMAEALRQQAVFVLAFPSDSFLVEVIRHGPRRRGPSRRRDGTSR